MIRITPTLTIPESEFEEDFVRSSGPGGQNVNKVSTAVQLRFNIWNSRSLPPRVRARLAALYAGRLTTEGTLCISAQRFRSQERNRQDARNRLAELVRAGLAEPKPRIRTRPTTGSRQRRLHAKKLAGARKKLRQRPGTDD
jgi:ribosome-associated protein